jgi:hypothetical protein
MRKRAARTAGRADAARPAPMRRSSFDLPRSCRGLIELHTHPSISIHSIGIYSVVDYKKTQRLVARGRLPHPPGAAEVGAS